MAARFLRGRGSARGANVRMAGSRAPTTGGIQVGGADAGCFGAALCFGRGRPGWRGAPSSAGANRSLDDGEGCGRGGPPRHVGGRGGVWPCSPRTSGSSLSLTPRVDDSTWLCTRAARPGSASSWSLRLVFLIQENSASVSFGHRPCPFGSMFFHNFYETVTGRAMSPEHGAILTPEL